MIIDLLTSLDNIASLHEIAVVGRKHVRYEALGLDSRNLGLFAVIHVSVSGQFNNDIRNQIAKAPNGGRIAR